MRLRSIRVASLLVGCVLSTALAGIVFAAAIPPAQRRALEKVDEALAELRANTVCPTCQGSGLSQVPTPEYRVRRGEAATRTILCQTCLGTGLHDRGRLKRSIGTVAAYVRTLYPRVLDMGRARAAESAIFDAQTLLIQDDVIGQLKRRLSRARLWNPDVLEIAASGSASPLRLDLSMSLPNLKRDLDRSAKLLPLPLLFEDAKAVDPPSQISFDVFTLRTMASSTRSFRNAVVAYLRYLHTPDDLKAAAASQPAQPASPPEKAE